MLDESPTAFTADTRTTREQPESHFKTRAHYQPDNFIVGAFTGGNLVATTGAVREAGSKRHHIATIWGVYVHPDHRGQRLAGQLLKEAVYRLSQLADLEVIQLSVTEGNDPALALYERAGFKTYGREPMALKFDGVAYDELLFSLSLV